MWSVLCRNVLTENTLISGWFFPNIPVWNRRWRINSPIRHIFTWTSTGKRNMSAFWRQRLKGWSIISSTTRASLAALNLTVTTLCLRSRNMHFSVRRRCRSCRWSISGRIWSTVMTGRQVWFPYIWRSGSRAAISTGASRRWWRYITWNSRENGVSKRLKRLRGCRITSLLRISWRLIRMPIS